MTTDTIFTEGSTVKATGRSVSGDEDMDPSAGHPGREYTVCYWVPADDKSNDDPQGKGYYLLDTDGSYGGSHWAYAEDLELVRSKADLDARKLPSIRDVSMTVASGLHSAFGSDGMEFHETSIEGQEGGEYIFANGKTDEGLPFSVKVAVLEVWESDF